ncbi:hypothetical protein [uncultured Vibrio sp.]|uniref:hypothetical protein n=1 Tax=uncultured Vibrio sp. TaxID=114054 RepID=UPI00091ECBD4|nr:hypothetical protein [uncultured Vibrio sp.]OIQ25667.1 MAG: hypothetical protein BM561_04505 [Vibrio sp. MedPE-SWchi]
MKILNIVVMIVLAGMFSGCANEHKLGHHMASVKAEQTYNPNATKENASVIPSGSGERMEGAYQVYTGIQSESLKGTESQVLQGFAQ